MILRPDGNNREPLVVGWARELELFESSQVCYGEDPSLAQPAFRYRPGTRPVLLSAPHGACHWREGRWKHQDGYTAALADLLARHTGAHALYTVRRIRPDPNYEDDSSYKEALAQLLRQHHIRLVLDLHGAHPEHEFGLALGTIDGTSCPTYEAAIIEHLVQQEFGLDRPAALDRLWVNRRFRGGVEQHTVTRFVRERCHVNAAQVEINAHLRIIRNGPAARGNDATRFAVDLARLERLIVALTNLITSI